jgi:hypothetical protein
MIHERKNPNKLDNIKIKKSFLSSVPVQKLKETTVWENVFANHIAKKGLPSRIHEELSYIDS